MRSWFSTPEAPQRILLAGVAAVALLAVIVIYAFGVLQPLQDAAIDESFTLRGPQSAPPGIVIIAVDNATLQRINHQLPIPRSYYARLLDIVHQDKPELIGLDLQFTGVSLPGQDSALLSAFSRDRPVLVTVTDAGTGVPTIAGVHNPAGVIAASGAVDPDRDGVLRKLMYAQVTIPTFAIRAAELVDRRQIPPGAVPGNHQWIDYDGPPGTFRTYPMADVLAGSVPAQAFAGKIVLVGVTATIAKDVFVTSASPLPMAGVEVWANSIDTVLRGFPLRSSALIWNLLLITGFTLFPLALNLRLSSLLTGLCSLALAIVFLGGAEFAFGQGVILPFPDPIVGLAISTAGVAAVEGYAERRRRLRLQATLQGFLRPAHWAFFISYRRDQSGYIAHSLRAALAAQIGGKDVFLDDRTIPPGQPFPQEILQAILGCSVMLVIIGPHWLDAGGAKPGERRLDQPGDWVRQEVEEGLRNDTMLVVPVLVDGASVPGQAVLPPSIRALSERQAFRVAGDDIPGEVKGLIEQIGQRRLLPPRPAGAPPEGVPSSPSSQHSERLRD
jgi:CHASE2 domain-containing sensor protein